MIMDLFPVRAQISQEEVWAVVGMENEKDTPFGLSPGSCLAWLLSCLATECETVVDTHQNMRKVV